MTTVNGLPAHVLLVHAIVVLLPLSALLLVLTAFWPAARARLAGANALLSIIVVALTPVTTGAGEWLERRVPQTALLQTHTDLGDGAVFYALPIAAMAVVVWWRQREAAIVAGQAAAHSERTGSGGGVATLSRTALPTRPLLAPTSTTVTRVVAALAVIVAALGVYGIYRIGDSGSKAAWTGRFSTTATVGGPGSD